VALEVAFYERLARRGVPGANAIVKSILAEDENPNHDPDGKFGSGGGGSGGGSGGTASGLASLTENEHALMRAMQSERSDKKALAKAGMSREEGIRAAASVRSKLGLAPGASTREAYRALIETFKRGAS
jgi:hypothetical protein